MHNTLSSMGYAQTGSISEGSLPESAEASVEVELRGGECYAFLALGVDGVTDINVRVYEARTRSRGTSPMTPKRPRAHVPQRTECTESSSRPSQEAAATS